MLRQTRNNARPRFARVRLLVRAVVAWVLVATVTACSPAERGDAPATDRPRVVATTTMIGDMVHALAGDDFDVYTVMQPGADPHLYRPTPSVAREISRSQLVISNGFHLEGWIDDLSENAGGDRAHVILSSRLEGLDDASFPGGIDPHFWFDIQLWSATAEPVAEALKSLGGPEVAAGVDERLAAFQAQLQALDTWTRSALATVPEAQRVLVTSHDAFNYFGRAYGLEVVGIQGLSTASEASQRDVVTVIERVQEAGLPAIFAETSVNPTLIERVSEETGARVAGPLYSDSLGPVDGPAGTYEGMIRENVRMIVDGLGGTIPPSPTHDDTP